MNIEKFYNKLDLRTKHLKNHPLITRVEINQCTYELIKGIKSVVEDSSPLTRPSE